MNSNVILSISSFVFLNPAEGEVLGKDLVIQVDGGVIEHPDGPRAGAVAVRQALEAISKGVNLEEFAKIRMELRKAPEKWSVPKPI